MVSSNMEEGECLVSGQKVSTVVPAKVTGEDKCYELTNIDLALKLHYIKAVYFFQSEAVQGFTIPILKEPMFELLEIFYTASGRIRRSETTPDGAPGRPYIRCNDGGVRVVEVNSEKTVDEWLQMEDRSLDIDLLAYNQVLGPDLGFSPLVYIQITWFKCGGISVGLSWAHVLGDIFAATSFINTWAQILSGHHPQKALRIPDKSDLVPSSNLAQYNNTPSLATKKIDPVGDHWFVSNSSKMKTHSFHVTQKQLNRILSTTIHNQTKESQVSQFEVVSALIWNSVSKIRADSGPSIVTICKNGRSLQERENEIPSNSIEISNVASNSAPSKTDILELAMLIAKSRVNQNCAIVETLEASNGEDFIIYGANLTFVNFEGVIAKEFEIKGNKTVFANFGIDGIGDEGAVMVIPGLTKEAAIIVTLVLPENQIAELKHELKKEWELA